MDKSLKEKAILENYGAFESMLPLLLVDHANEFALLREGAVSGFFDSASEAHFAGTRMFADGLFSVQRVEDKAMDLGFFSHARYSRVA